MSRLLPKTLEKLINQLEKLPGVGHRTAERYAYDLLKGTPASARQIADSLTQLHQNVKYCPKTFCLIEAGEDYSPTYADNDRDRTTIAVVAQPFDVIAIEKTSLYKGTYHVLGGLLSPIDGVGPQDLTLQELFGRIEPDHVREIILAVNSSVEGETTALYIRGYLKDIPRLKITRLARGLPVGVDIEFADNITLSQALEGRQPMP